MKLIDYYPETLRDIYDKIEDTIAEAGAVSPNVDIALYVTEWIREHWSRRVLVPSWWGVPASGPVEEGAELPGVLVQVDQLRTVRGRELRDVVCSILLLGNTGISNPCFLAGLIAARVETEWSRMKIYVPRASNIDRAIRDAQIWQDFNGFGSVERVVGKHQVCQSMIYDISRRLQKDKDAREQPLLPGCL